MNNLKQSQDRTSLISSAVIAIVSLCLLAGVVWIVRLALDSFNQISMVLQ